jgi:hypothetical protein
MKSQIEGEGERSRLFSLVFGRIRFSCVKSSVILVSYYLLTGFLFSAVLFCGTCDSGKTTLFTQLLHGKPMETYTSMKVIKYALS